MKDGLFDDTGNIVAASRMYMPGWMDRYVAFVKRHTGWNGRRGEPLVRRRRITPQPSIDSASCSVRAQVVIAPSDAEFTSRTYLLSTPRGTSRGGRVQRARVMGLFAHVQPGVSDGLCKGGGCRPEGV